MRVNIPCQKCREYFRPRPERGEDHGSLCRECRESAKYFANVAAADQPRTTVTVEEVAMASKTETRGVIPPPRRACACGSDFVVPKNQPEQMRCSACRRLAERPREANPYKKGARREEIATLTPPLTVGVFDLETWGLDRGWGVTMVGSILIHNGKAPKVETFTLRDTKPYKAGTRSNDMELGRIILEKLYECDVLIAHNGLKFDIPWLNSVALKYKMPRLITKKLIDPVQIGRKRYRIGGNALSSMAEFLGLVENKMPVGRDVWRKALLDDDAASWESLRERCESDVRLLNEVACQVVPDAGLIDGTGSAGR